MAVVSLERLTCSRRLSFNTIIALLLLPGLHTADQSQRNLGLWCQKAVWPADEHLNDHSLTLSSTLSRLKRLVMNVLQTFLFPSGWTAVTLLILWLFIWTVRGCDWPHCVVLLELSTLFHTGRKSVWTQSYRHGDHRDYKDRGDGLFVRL